MSDRNDYVRELVNEVAPRVWLGVSGNGSLRIDIDTDVQCYGKWEPHGPFGIGPRTDDKVAYAQSWIEFFVRSTIYRLVDKGLLTVPEGDDSCYCVCHSPYSSRPQCEHCQPDAVIGQGGGAIG